MNKRVSGSWRADEIAAGARVMRALLQGADVRVLARGQDFQRFARNTIRLDDRAKGEKRRKPPALYLELVRALSDCPARDAFTNADAVTATQWDYHRVWNAMKCARREGLVETVARGRRSTYRLTSRALARTA